MNQFIAAYKRKHHPFSFFTGLAKPLSLFVILILLGAIPATSQITMNNSGRVRIGPGNPPTSTYNLQTTNLNASTANFTKGTYYGINGNNGLATLRIFGGSEVGVGYTSEAARIYGQFSSSGSRVTSDIRIKKDIEPISKANMRDLEKIEGISYHYKSYEEILATDIAGVHTFKMDTIYDEEGMMHLRDEREMKYSYDDRLHYGLSAQNVMETYPELVHYDSTDGIYTVSYESFIPILIEVAKLQHEQIERLKDRVATFEETGTNQRTINEEQESEEQVEVDQNSDLLPSLSQNRPNPFNTTTYIDTYIPPEVADATLYIYDVQGTQKRKVIIDSRGATSIPIEASSLVAGIYMYALIIDGKEVGIKRMILTD